MAMRKTKIPMNRPNEAQRMAIPRRREAVIDSFNADERTATISFASETPCPDHWGDMEILRCTPEAMDTQRCTDGVMPLLYNHNRDAVIGKPTRIWTENKRAYAEIKFAETDEAEKIMALVRDGFLRGVSVGYRVLEWLVVKKGTTTADGIQGPAYIGSRWEVFEISLVTVPADATVGVGRSLLYDDTLAFSVESEEEREMPENMTEEEIRAQAEEQARAAARAERERISSIEAVCRSMNIESELEQKWINEERDLGFVNAEILKILAERKAPANVPLKTEVGTPNYEAKRELYAQGYLARSGMPVKDAKADSEKYRHMSMKSIAIDMLTDRGEKDVMRLSDDELLKRAITTGAMPLVLSDITQTALLQGYQTAGVTYDRWARIGSVPDFREWHSVKIGMDGEPLKIPENGEFTDTEMAETEQYVRIDTYGRSYSYTREAFINDDKNVLTEIPARLGRKFQILINRMVYAALVNGTFTANVNLGTAAAIGTKSMSEAMKLLKLRKDELSNEPLRINPRYLLVPVAIEADAAQFLRSTADPSATHAGVVNIYNGALQIIADPELDDNSSTAWYVVGDTVAGEGVEVDFLNGNRTPILESQLAFDTLGWRYRAYLDFGVKCLSTLPYVKNAGK